MKNPATLELWPAWPSKLIENKAKLQTVHGLLVI